MYDYQVARFHTIDIKSEVYNQVSSYAYAMNAPVRFADVDGQEIGIVDPSDPKHPIPFRPNSAPPVGASDFVKQAWESINYSYNSGDAYAKTVIDKVASAEDYMVKVNSTKLFGITGFLAVNKKKALIDYNPYEGLLVGKTGAGRQSPATGLYHEIYHSFQYMLLVNALKSAKSCGDKIAIKEAKLALYNFRNNHDPEFRRVNYEEAATAIENSVARLKNEDERAFYEDEIGSYGTKGPLSTSPGPFTPTKDEISEMGPARSNFFNMYGF